MSGIKDADALNLFGVDRHAPPAAAATRGGPRQKRRRERERGAEQRSAIDAAASMSEDASLRDPPGTPPSDNPAWGKNAASLAASLSLPRNQDLQRNQTLQPTSSSRDLNQDGAGGVGAAASPLPERGRGGSKRVQIKAHSVIIPRENPPRRPTPERPPPPPGVLAAMEERGLNLSGRVGNSGFLASSLLKVETLSRSSTMRGAPGTPSRNMNESFIACMDPTCNKCPPEMHERRNRRMLMMQADDGGSFPEPSLMRLKSVRTAGNSGRKEGDADEEGGGEGEVAGEGGVGGGGGGKVEGGGKWIGGKGDEEDDDEFDGDESDEEGERRTVIRILGIPCCVIRPRTSKKSLTVRWLQCWSFLFSSLGPFNPHSGFINKWNKAFLCISILGFAVDPLFFFVLGAVQSPTQFCISVNKSLTIVLAVLRCFVDLVHFIQIFIKFRTAYVVPPPSPRSWWLQLLRWLPLLASDFASSDATPLSDPSGLQPGELAFDSAAIMKHYLRSYFLIDIVAALPLPQILFLIDISNTSYLELGPNSIVIAAFIIILVQFALRSYRFMPILSGSSHHSPGFVFETAWANFLLNFIMYIVAAHVVGAVWYLLAVRRLDDCLHEACTMSGTACLPSFIYCGQSAPPPSSSSPPLPPLESEWATGNATLCLQTGSSPATEAVSPFPFPYGIFGNALPVVLSQSVFQKYIYALFWGFQQVSTLAGNQVPSTWPFEVLFIIVVIIMGLILLALLISNMSNFLQALSKRAFEYQLMRRDLDLWMDRSNLPPNIQERVKALQRLQWVTNRGVDEEELLMMMTDDIQRDVRRSLCFELLQTSVLFKAMEPQVLDAFCERMRKQIFIQGTVIVRERYPVQRLFFVTRGEVESRATFSGRTGLVDSVVLGKGEFFGEELLVEYLDRLSGSQWAIGRSASRRYDYGRSYSGSTVPSSHDVFPSAQRTIRCLGPVEGYSLEAADVEFVCKQFSRMLRTNKMQAALNQCCRSRRTHAARTIQVAWRRYRRKKLGWSIARVVEDIKMKWLQALAKQKKTPGAAELVAELMS